MSNQQWQEGGTYRFNPEITRLLGNEPFTVKTVNSAGAVIELVEFYIQNYNISYWFDADEIKYFELVEDDTQEITMNDTINIRPEPAIVMEWLDKLQYVLQVDTTVGGNLVSISSGMVLDTDFGDITGAKDIYNFITKRYDLLQQEAKHKKNNELMERKAKLEAELAELYKELGNV